MIQTYTLPYVRIIRDLLPPGGRIALFTLEKELMAPDEAKQVKRNLKAEGIEWLPFRYHRFGVRMLLKFAWLLPYLSYYVIRNRINVVHAWCTPAGAMGYMISKSTGRELIIDSYEPHAEPMVEAGQWQRGSLAFRLMWWFEKRQSHRAKTVIACVSAMETYAAEKYGATFDHFYWKPACVDVDLFHPAKKKNSELIKKYGLQDKIVAVYAGKFGGSYLKEELFRFFALCEARWGERFRVVLLNNQDPAELAQWAAGAGFDYHKVIQEFVPHCEVPEFMGLGDFGLVPFVPAPGKRYGSPIKTSEYWAMGLPIVISEGISDDADITEHNSFGIVIKDWDHIDDQRLAKLELLMRNEGKSELMRDFVLRERRYGQTKSVYEKIFV